MYKPTPTPGLASSTVGHTFNGWSISNSICSSIYPCKPIIVSMKRHITKRVLSSASQYVNGKICSDALSTSV